jgi:hypothetical protein
MKFRSKSHVLFLNLNDVLFHSRVAAFEPFVSPLPPLRRERTLAGGNRGHAGAGQAALCLLIDIPCNCSG